MRIIEYLSPLVCAVLAYLFAVNVTAFILYGEDKKRARKYQWRIPEKTLLGVSFAGGFIGALLGMKIWHHKTKKLLFQICVPLSALLWIAGGAALLVLKFTSKGNVF